MKRKLIFLTLAAILIAQPLMVVNLGTFATDMSTPESSEMFSPAQGTRLAPGELTNHVPIFINKTADFVSQGWPGSGTSGDPYVIEGLNITYANGMVSIGIYNTDAYFVIRDCYINQGSTEWSIELNYATHGTVEYTTIDSQTYGIFLYEANFTTISHCDVLVRGVSVNPYALWMQNSTDSIVEWSTFNSTNWRSTWIWLSPNLLMQHNSFDSHSSEYGLTINNSNNSVVKHNTATDSYYGFNINNCFDLEIYNHTITDSTFGFMIDNCPRIEINSSSALTQVPLTMDNSHNATIVDSIFEGAGITNSLVDMNNCGDTIFARNIVEGGSDNGLELSNSDDTVLEDNAIIDCSPNGITIAFSDDVQVLSNTVENCSANGIEVDTSQWIILESNNVSMTGNVGFHVTSSHNGIFTGNVMSETLDYGFMSSLGENWTANGNYFTECDGGIAFSSGENLEISDNTLTAIVDRAISVTSFDNTWIYNNNITGTNDGIFVDNSDWIDIENNVVSNVDSYAISLASSINSTINDNDITNVVEVGMIISDISNVQVHMNTFADCELAGLAIMIGMNLTLTNNTFVQCGMYFAPVSSIQYFNHTIENNVVNGQPLYYGVSVQGSTINAADYGQVILFDCNGTSITGTSFDRCTIPVQIFYSLLISVDNITSHNNLVGILAYQSSNTTITNTLVYGSTSFETVGVYVSASDHFYVSDLVNYDGAAGIITTNSDFGYILDSTFTRGYQGIMEQSSSNNVTVDNCTFLHIEDSAAYIMGNYWSITNSYFYNISANGVFVDAGDYNYIADNYFEHCSRGVYVEGSSTDYGNITNNEMYSCTYAGIYITSGDLWGIHGNTILWSGTYGIRLFGSTSTEVYSNTIGISGSSNGYDDITQFWDNGIDTGNAWSDFDGVTIPYVVGISGATDRYPSLFLPTNPIIDNPLDVYYAEGDTGNEITWKVYDDYLKNYTVTIDGELWDADASPETSYAEITVNVDGLAYGDHLVEIVIWDINSNNVTNVLTIHVFDDTPPEINTPPNIEAFVGASGQTITWAASDLNPGAYSLLRNDVEVETGTWATGNITVSVDGLSAGVYAFEMIVFDLDGNHASDTVLVLVIADDESPTIDHPGDITFVVGTTGNRIIWTPSDDNPSSFQIGSNSSVYASGSWAGSRIILDLDGLAAGEYTFTILVYDGTGNSASDAVKVTVIAQEPATTDVPLDVGLILMVLGVVGGIIVVIVIVYILKSKTAKP